MPQDFVKKNKKIVPNNTKSYPMKPGNWYYVRNKHVPNGYNIVGVMKNRDGVDWVIGDDHYQDWTEVEKFDMSLLIGKVPKPIK